MDAALKQLLRTRLDYSLRSRLASAMRNYVPHGKQFLFHTLGADAQERMFLGGNRTGKTVCGTQEMAIHLTGLYPSWWQGHRFDGPVRAWAGGESIESVRDILQPLYLGDAEQLIVGSIPRDRIVKVKERKNSVSGAIDYILVRHVSGGVSKLGFKSYDMKRKKWQGTKLHLVHLDEEPDISIYNEALMRLADYKGLMILTMTPLKGMTKVCLDFLDENVPGKVSADKRAYVQAGWVDNPFIPEEEKQRLCSRFNPRELRMRELGLPDLGGGRAHPDFDRELNIMELAIPEGDIWVGMDFNVDNMSAALGYKYKDALYIFDEITLPERSNTDLMCKEIKERYPGRRIYVCPDASGHNNSTNAPIGQSDHKIIRDHGFVVVTDNRNPSIKDRLASVNALIMNGQGVRRLFVDPRRCKKLIKCLTMLVCKEGTMIPDKTQGLDHLPDALGYLVMQLCPIMEKRFSFAKHKGI